MKQAIVDEFSTCINCGYRLRPGWKTDAHAEVCGKCADEVGVEADHTAVNDQNYTTHDPYRGGGE